MPYPEKPTITYDYSAFQESQGDNDFPGTHLDVDLANLKAALDATIDFVSATIRSDGYLYASKIEGSVTGAAGAGYGGTSTSSVAIGTGSKTFTTQSGLAYVAGSRVRAASAAAPTAKWVEGVVTAYAGTSLTLTADATNGSGSATDWSFSLAGQPGIGGYVPTAADRIQYGTAAGATAETPLTAAGRALLDDADAAAQRATLGLAIGTDVQGYSARTAALAALSSTGFLAQTGSTAYAQRSLAAPAAGFTITNANGVSGNPTFALADDLAALEAMSGTGLGARTGTSTWAPRSVVGSGVVTVTNGDGVAGNPTVSLQAGSIGDILVYGSSGWELLSAGTSGYFLKALGAGVKPAWAALSGGGDLLSTNNLSDLGNAKVALQNIGAAWPGLINGKVSAAVAANALTVAIKGLDGNDPSSTNPVGIAVRDAAGSVATRWLTAATSLVVSSGSTMGAAAINTAFALWLVAFDDAGTVRLGLVNCLSGRSIYPLGGLLTASSTAEGGAGAADSAHVIYTGTAVSSKPFAILARLEWSSGLATLGAWASAPSTTALYRPGMALPGAVVQVAETLDTTTRTTTSTSFTNSGISAAITPTSAANAVRVTFAGGGDTDAAGSSFGFDVNRGSSLATLFGRDYVISAVKQGSGSGVIPQTFSVVDLPGVATALTYQLQWKVTGGTATLSARNGSAITVAATFRLEELQT